MKDGSMAWQSDRWYNAARRHGTGASFNEGIDRRTVCFYDRIWSNTIEHNEENSHINFPVRCYFPCARVILKSGICYLLWTTCPCLDFILPSKASNDTSCYRKTIHKHHKYICQSRRSNIPVLGTSQALMGILDFPDHLVAEWDPHPEQGCRSGMSQTPLPGLRY